MSRLYCIPKLNEIEKFVDFSKKYNAGFEYNDFFIPSVLDDEAEIERIIGEYMKLDRDRSADTLHGVFLDICINSDDSLIYKASDYRVHQSMDIATRLGVRAVIFHTNNITNFRLKSYQDGWVSRNEKYWRHLLAEYPDLCVYVENMFDDNAELLQRLAESMADEPRFGVCFDLAHAFIGTEPLAEWCHDLKPYVKHMHINDNDEVEDTHHPVGSMQLPWIIYKEFIDSIPEDKLPSVLIEVRSYDDLMASVAYMEKNGLYPFGV